jgi:hypothetical protein
MKTPHSFLSKFIRDKRGLAHVWTVALITLGFSPFVFWVLNTPLMMVESWATGFYTFTGNVLLAYNVMNFFASYLLAFILVAVMFWVLINSKAERTVYG